MKWTVDNSLRVRKVSTAGKDFLKEAIGKFRSLTERLTEDETQKKYTYLYFTDCFESSGLVLEVPTSTRMPSFDY